jgi:hypothetical protein
VNLTWTRGRTILQHTDRRKNGQPGLFGGPALAAELGRWSDAEAYDGEAQMKLLEEHA